MEQQEKALFFVTESNSPAAQCQRYHTGLTSAVNNNKDRNLSSLLAIIMNNFFLASLAVLSGDTQKFALGSLFSRLGQSSEDL